LTPLYVKMANVGPEIQAPTNAGWATGECPNPLLKGTAGSNEDDLTPSHAPEWIQCRYCGLHQPLPIPLEGYGRSCRRCHGSFGHGRQGFRTALPLLLTALVLCAVVQAFPLLGIDLDGLNQEAGVGSGIIALLSYNFAPLAILVLIVSTIAPLFRILANTYVLISLQLGRRTRHLLAIFKLSEQFRPWAMLDVLLLGTLIAVTKLHDIATIEVGIGLWSLGPLVLALAILDALLDRRAVWNALSPNSAVLSQQEPSAAITCLSCGLLNSVQESSGPSQRCSRCLSRLFRRKPDSVTRTWALVVTGLLLYIPANVYPALTVISFGQGAPSTILGGVMELMNGEDWPLALLIFTASVAVPVLKLLGLTGLLISIRLRLRGWVQDRTRLYRIIEFIGRWSMIDIFVAALLTALVTLGRVATVEPGVGILAFGGVVVATMFAAESFDPRLMWDAAEINDG
jgi:paraquat-inducible protein A